MEKVICVKCGSIGFTAAPKYVRCSQCGGRHKIIPFSKDDLKNKKNIGLLSFIRETGIIFSRLEPARVIFQTRRLSE